MHHRHRFTARTARWGDRGFDPRLLALLGMAVVATGSTTLVRHAPTLPARSASSTSLSSAPAGLRLAASAAIGSTSARYFVKRTHGALLANGGGLTTVFGFAGPTIHVGTASLGLRLIGVGRNQLRAPGRAPPSATRNKVAYRRSGVTEWYRNGLFGLEQGFTLATRPKGSTADWVTLAVRTSGLQLSQHGSQIVIGRTLARYGQLSAVDATGKHVRSRLILRGKTILLQVRDRGARYPLTIDPLIQAGPKFTVTTPGALADAAFGESVAISGDGSTAALAGPGDNLGNGAVWIFVQRGGTWSGTGDNRVETGGIWSEQGPKLTPNDATGAPTFGSQVALSRTGDTLLAGGPNDDSLNGAAWVFTRSGGAWSQQGTKLTPTNPVGAAFFGGFVSLSDDGRIALIGGDSDNGGVGAAWVFTFDDVRGHWTQSTKLTGQGELGNGSFGHSVALSGDSTTALIGGFNDSNTSGAVWAFTRSGAQWTQQQELNDVNPGDGFGFSVAISRDGNEGLIGVPDRTPSGIAQAGAVIPIKRLPAGNWVNDGAEIDGPVASGELGTVVAISADGLVGAGSPSDPSQGIDMIRHIPGNSSWSLDTTITEPNGIGGGLALSGDGSTFIGGASRDGSGVAWVFAYDGSAWNQEGWGPLRAGVENEVSASGIDAQFGYASAVSRDGSTAIVGMPTDGLLDNPTGAVLVFTKTAGVWTQQGPRLVPFDGSGTDYFGTSVALSDDGDTAVIGSQSPAEGAWVFTREGGNWTQEGPMLVGSAALGSGSFPVQVGVSGDGNTALIGSEGDASGQGAAWFFTRDATGTWTQQGPKIASPSETSFGSSVALSSDATTALIGAEGSDAVQVFTQSGGVWEVQQTLTQGPVGGAIRFGHSAALSSDGNTALVGAGEGLSAWVFTRTATSWSLNAVLTPSDAAPDGTANSSLFGSSVALSSSGDTAAIGGYFDGEGSSQAGTAWAFHRANGTWAQQGPKLTPGDGIAMGWMGYSVAISGAGDTIFAGQPSQDSQQGAAWIFTQSGNTWTRAQTVNGRGAEEGLGLLGKSIALSQDGHTAIVGAPQDDSATGAAWVFTESNGVWSRQGPKLSPSDAIFQAGFGSSVALSADGNTALIGAPGPTGQIGQAWIFTRVNGRWMQSGRALQLGGSGTHFGASVAMSPDATFALIGAPDGPENFLAGNVFVFKNTGGVWSYDSTLTPSDATGGSRIGFSVAISADETTAIIGGDMDNSGLGAAWVFTQTNGSWSQQGSKLLPNDNNGTLVLFGRSVALSSDGSTAAISGMRDNSDLGAAWVFTRSGAVWTQDGAKLVPSDGTGSPRFGANLGMSADGTTLVIGGSQDNTNVGAAWQFSRVNGLWTQVGPKLVSDDGSVTNLQEFGIAVALSTDGQFALIGGPDDDNSHGAFWVFSQGAQAPPGRPTVAIGTAGDGQATVSFTPPGSDGNSPITSYTVTASPGGTTATGDSSPITVTGLTNGTIYTFTVTATNAIGTSLPSVPSNPVIPFGPTSASLVAAASSVPAGASYVIPKKVPTTSIPMQMLAQAAAPLSDIGLAGSPLSDIPLSDIGLAGSASPLTNVPLSRLPLLNNTWQQVLTGTPLASAPLQTVTFGQALQAVPDRVSAIHLSEIDLSGTPLSDIGLAAIVLGGIPLSDIPLQIATGGANALTAWCHAVSGPPVSCTSPASLAGDTLMTLALEGAPLSDIPLSDIPLSDIPLSDIPLSDIPLSDINIAASPLSDIPLSDISTPSSFVDCPAKIDCSTATIGDAAAAGAIKPNVLYGDFAKAVPLSDIPLSDIPLSDVPLSDISLTPSMITSSPLSDIPLSDIPLSDIGTIINCAIAPPSTCTASRTGTLGSVANAIKGTLADIAKYSSAPLSDIPLSDISLTPAMITSSPLSDIPLSDIPLSDIGTIINCATAPPTTCTASRTGTLGSVANFIRGTFADLVRAIPLSDIPLSDIPLSDIPLSDIKLSAANIVDSPLSDIPLSDIPLTDIGTIIDCTNFHSDCDPATNTGRTLGDAASNHEFKTDATLADLAPLLPGTTKFGDLLVAMINPATFPWEQLPYTSDAMRTQEFAEQGSVPGVIEYTLTFIAPASATNAVVTMPPGALYEANSAKLDLGGVDVGTPQPTVNGGQLDWALSSLTPDGKYELSFGVRAPLAIGLTEGTATVGDVVASPSAVLITETNTNNPTAATATGLDSNDVYFGYIGTPGETHYFTVPAPSTLGSRVIVRLSSTTGDDDMVVYQPAGQQVQFASTGIPITSPPADDSTTGIQPSTAQDIDIPNIDGDVVAAVSANRGTTPETATLNSTGAGGEYVIKVTGYNAVSSPLPFTLRIETDNPPAPPGPCVARTLSGGVAHSLPVASSIPSNLNTLFLVDSKRIGDEFGTNAEQQVWDKLTALAGATTLGVSGAVIPVEGNQPTEDAYTAWDQNPCDPLRANAVSNSIVAMVDQYYGQHPTTLKYVVLVGADDILPMKRVADNTQQANERDFAPAFGASNNEYYGALSNRYLLSDTPYGTIYPTPGPFNRAIYVPNLSVGRLVETPNEIIDAIDRFTGPTVNGALDPTTALTTGYDFLTDGAKSIANSFDSFGYLTHPTSRLISDTWTRQNLEDAIGQFPGIVSLNAHFDTSRALPAIGNKTHNQTDLYSIAKINTLPAGRLAGGIWFSMGCHSGLNVSDVVVGASSPMAGDWAQTLAGQQGVVYGANSGYGYGDSAAVLYSARLMGLFAQNLDGSLSVGDAWKQAIRNYWGTTANISVYDEKVMEEATLYGLPFYGIGHSPTPVHSTRMASTAGASLSLPVDDMTGVGTVPFTLQPGFTEHFSPHYWEGDNGVSAVVGQPIVPVSTRGVTVPGEVAHGVLITTPLVSADEQNFHDAFSQPVIDGSDGPATPTPGASFPSTIATLRSSGSRTDPDQTAILATGAFFSGDTPGVGLMRRWTTISGKTLYSPSTDFTPPTIQSSSASTDGSTVTFKVDATDPDDSVKFVYVLYRDATLTWQSATLAQDAIGLWVGSGPASGDRVEFFVQAGDTNGNIGVSTNKAEYFLARGRVTIGLNGTTDSNGFFTGPVQVSAISSTGSALQASVDGAAASDYNGAFTVSANGAHNIVVTAADGADATQLFAIRGAGPAIAITTPTDGSAYLRNSHQHAAYTCTEQGSGVATCSGPVAPGADIDTSTAGAKAFTVTSTDSSGVSSTKTVSYTVYTPVVPGPPTLTAPATSLTTAVSVSGKGKAGAAITVLEGSTTVGSGTVAADGTWSTVVTLPIGFHTLTATQTLDGETSARSAPVTVRVQLLITASPKNWSGVEGASRTAMLATFTINNLFANASGYSATINWGDNSPSGTGTVTSTGPGTFAISGTHAYADEGSFPIAVTITDRTDPSTTATVRPIATITDAALAATSPTFVPSLQSFSGAVATFTDANAGAPVADFSATINWGDNKSSAGSILQVGAAFTVTGNHTYASTGYYTVAVTITDRGGSTARTSGRVLVYAFPVGGAFTIGDRSTGTVTFWGSQWAKANTLSKGTAPSSFKGFVLASNPTCGASWTTGTGASPVPPPAPLPAYMGVIVASQAGQSGSAIIGSAFHIVVVQTNAGYNASPSTPGTGTVVATIC